jgi:hypothetical protein
MTAERKPKEAYNAEQRMYQDSMNETPFPAIIISLMVAASGIWHVRSRSQIQFQDT